MLVSPSVRWSAINLSCNGSVVPVVVPLSVRIPITVVRVEMTNFIKRLVGTGSSTISSRIDEHIRQIQENTQKYENKLSVSIEEWEQYIKFWKMSKQNIKELYKVESFEFKRDYRIKISEYSFNRTEALIQF